MSLMLGIDTGGTFTDAALVDDRREVVAVAKQLTTRHDLTVGIARAIDSLPPEHLGEVAMVSLSTTLTTNSVVEGKGSPVCALLIGYDEQQVRNSGLAELLGPESIVTIAGGHDAAGQEDTALDEQAVRAAILNWRDKVSAFAISATFSVRNPGHEIRVRELVRELSHKPVTCGHELASSLGAPRRAATVALNARMIAHVQQLIESVETILAARGIHAPLMIVKGDGSLVNASSAMQRPVGTVLSGPAASVLGACALSGLRDAIVADMGGTTTDIAVVRNGRPELSFDGALIGGWQPMIEAVRIYSIGLGGDSEVRFSGGLGIAIGPRRVVPLSLLASEHPEVLPALERQAVSSPNGSQLRFALRLQHDEAQLGRLPDDERQAWERLAKGPVDIERTVVEDRRLARALARLERRGMAIYSGFTPTDAAHVLGISSHWSTPAAMLGARIWARQMRHLYGFGTWPEGDAEGPSRQVFDLVIEGISQKLIEAGLHEQNQLAAAQADKLSRLLTEITLEQRRDPTKPSVFSISFAADTPVVAVGGPAASYYPEVAQGLRVGLYMPRFAEVANAVGAVLGEVAQRVHLTIAQPVRGTFRVFTQRGPKDFRQLDTAIEHARELAAAEATELALAAGAASVQVAFEHDENKVSNDIDGDVFFEMRLTAVASGPPCARIGGAAEQACAVR
ncbi:hydantoinase/oxoprolinase N-terminal domain-containing protein [Denitromonas iodatirespirans]|uniref:Hydantoinase/oxoprolinase family protein n=1 Tax=Denitromonas iodatirespirans TaxID=2795389 RepID=A0A944HBP9_DENI1|nr:hydantoinase/oxoprolinase family protein [Denitromonas iodatirespirans]MBT0961897.1 hydantoinase/oxoprolinase family protein [Denitromonas iodatirespirans]